MRRTVILDSIQNPQGGELTWMGDDAVHRFHPLMPVPSTGSPSPLIPLPSRERGFLATLGMTWLQPCTVILDLIQNPQGGVMDMDRHGWGGRHSRAYSPRHSPRKRESTGTGTPATMPCIVPLSLDETFAKLSGTTIMRLDFQSAKLDFPIDSRRRWNDDRFCKGLLDGRGIKGEGDSRMSPPRFWIKSRMTMRGIATRPPCGLPLPRGKTVYRARK